MSVREFEPKLFQVLRGGYNRATFFKDLLAGVIVGVVALPLAIAFGIASGVKPEQGLYTAIVAGFLISCFGGSRFQIGGPTGAFIVIVYGIVQQYGYDGLATATLMAGVMLVVMGFLRFGAIIRYIPFPVTVGFTGGIALIIAIGQLRSFFGLSLVVEPSDALGKLGMIIQHVGEANPWTVLVGVTSLSIAVFFPRVTTKVPASLIAIFVGTLLVYWFQLPVETIGTKYGEVPHTLPTPHLPAIDLDTMRGLFQPAISIALLGGIESLLSAVVADGMTGRKHRSNVELVGQGVANMVSPLFMGIPATGAIARTATNIRSGALTPVSGLVHAVTLLLIMLVFAKWAALIPMATLSAILLVVAYNMSEWRTFVKIFRSPRSDVMVLLTTFALTILIDLTVAIQVGVVLAALLFIRRMAQESKIDFLTEALSEEDADEKPDPNSISTRKIPKGVAVFEIQGSLFFAAIETFRNTLAEMDSKPRVLILRMRNVLAIDASGLQMIEDLWKRSQKEGFRLLLSGVHTQPTMAMAKSGLMDRIGEESYCANIDAALEKACDYLEQHPRKTQAVPIVS